MLAAFHMLTGYMWLVATILELGRLLNFTIMYSAPLDSTDPESRLCHSLNHEHCWVFPEAFCGPKCNIKSHSTLFIGHVAHHGLKNR